MPGIPATVSLTCPRCRVVRLAWNVDGGTVFRCMGCDWYLTLSAVAPTATATAGLAAGGTAITVAAGGASFTAGMILLADTGNSAEIVTVNGAATATSIPVTAAIKAHTSGFTFGQLQVAGTYTAQIAAGYGTVEIQAVQPLPGWGF